jgi:prevent-host-death family protein
MASRPRRPIPAATFGRNFGRYKDLAISDGVVEVSSNGRPVGAYLSQEEYERYLAFKRLADIRNQSAEKV